MKGNDFQCQMRHFSLLRSLHFFVACLAGLIPSSHRAPRDHLLNFSLVLSASVAPATFTSQLMSHYRIQGSVALACTQLRDIVRRDTHKKFSS